MKAYEVMDALFALVEKPGFGFGCDTCKAGDPNKDVAKVAVSMFANPAVVRAAKAWGAQLLIVHEPTYYNHLDEHSDERIETMKRALIEESGMTVYRYHDAPHNNLPDIISEGVVRLLDLDADVEYLDYRDHARITMRTPITARELAQRVTDKLGIRHPRICGTTDTPCTRISLLCGTPGGVFEELKNPDCEILLTGEACEWALGEYARDAHELGITKSLLILGHIGSERAGMQYAADILKKLCPALDVRYFESGEVYTYAD